MRWIIGSDLHGSAEFTKQFLKRADAEKADQILLLGDIHMVEDIVFVNAGNGNGELLFVTVGKGQLLTDFQFQLVGQFLGNDDSIVRQGQGFMFLFRI